MPKMTITTKSSEQVWSGGGRTIWKVVLEINGKLFNAKTYSSAIADVGFSGEVETYERDGKYGAETFVRQVPKEGGFSGGSSGGGYQPKDEKAIQAMWSIGQAIQALSEKAKDSINLSDIEANAQELFLMVGRVKAVDELDKPDAVTEVFGETEEISDELNLDIPDL